jgi:phage shock protein C
MKRDLENKMFLGVCAGIAKEYGIDVTFVRLGFVLACLFGLGLPVIVYLILAVVMQ